MFVLTLVFALTACGSNAQTAPASNPEPAQTESQGNASTAVESANEAAAEGPNREELIKQYVGKYRMTELTSGENDLTDFYQQHWEDKSIYSYIEIKDDFSFTEKMVQNGSVTVTSTAYLDPVDLTLHNVDTFTDGKGTPLDLKDGVITIESSKGSRGVFELSDEVPDDPVPEG
ncbi:MAG: hypothetical protein Q4D71_08165 [Oscillospiraceae bacterium]|nr:hypothetical protein [Oscillospiraceae bacterium]